MPVISQSNTTASFDWNIFADLPSFNHQDKSIGVAGPIVGVLQNKLIVAGGANFPEKMPWQGGKKMYYNHIFIFEKNNKLATPVKNEITLPHNNAYSASCITPLGIVYAGGENESGLSQKVYLIKWDKESNSMIIVNLPDLPEPITNASLSYLDNTIYFIGGETTTTTSNHFISLDLAHLKEGWHQLPSIPKPLSNLVSAAFLSNAHKQIFIIGGRAKQKNGISIFSSEVYAFDIKNKTWNVKKELPYAISAGTGLLVNDSYIILFGGDKGDRFNMVETQISKINLENDTVVKNKLNLVKNNLLETHPGFSGEILLYHIQKNQWISNGLMPFTTAVTTQAVQWGNEVVIPSGEIKAGVRTPRIMTAKISFHE